MRVERTAWEKMTAIHVFCLQGNIKEHLARHWSDIVRLDAAGHIEAAINDRAIARRVADHKSRFFIEKDARNNKIDYFSAINGGLVLVPEGDVLKLLAADYARWWRIAYSFATLLLMFSIELVGAAAEVAGLVVPRLVSSCAHSARSSNALR